MTEGNHLSGERRAVLVLALLPAAGSATGKQTPIDPEDAFFSELRGLCESCGITPVGELAQRLAAEDSAYYIGRGKVEELKNRIFLDDADLVVFNNTLSPSQLANLSHDLEVEVIDRTTLILNIFAERARTMEAKLQVDYARMQYMLPRLVGLRQNLSRQGGTGGSLSNKGSGETQIELDRRHILNRMASIRRSMKEIEKNRTIQRKRRQRSGLPLIALVGYTNAGKSTLMNRFLELSAAYGNPYSHDSAPALRETGQSGQKDQSRQSERQSFTMKTMKREKQVFAKDMLFATLDTTVRRITPENGRPFLLSDTVGFIRDLPHGLVDAFRSTLEEVVCADLILEVVDGSDPSCSSHIEVTDKVLEELGAGGIPRIYVMNKADRAGEAGAGLGAPDNILFLHDRVQISAASGAGIPKLLGMIQERLSEGYYPCSLIIPYSEGAVERILREQAVVEEVRYEEDGIHVRGRLGQAMLQRYKAYIQV